MSHGTSFSSVIGIAQHGGITVSHNKDDSFPSFGFSARGSLTSYSKESLISAVTKTAARAKFLGGVMVLVEATLPGPTPSAEGGNDTYTPPAETVAVCVVETTSSLHRDMQFCVA